MSPLSSISKQLTLTWIHELPSRPSVSLSVQWAQWHPMTHLIGMYECSLGASEICCAYPHGPWVLSSPVCWWFSWTVSHRQYVLHPSTYRFGKLSFWNKDWCFQPQEIIYIIMMREMNRAQDGFQPSCPVFCQETFWQACFFVTSLLDITKNRELLFSIRELKKPASLCSKYIWK